jgi:hypothetical protein
MPGELRELARALCHATLEARIEVSQGLILLALALGERCVA